MVTRAIGWNVAGSNETVWTAMSVSTYVPRTNRREAKVACCSLSFCLCPRVDAVCVGILDDRSTSVPSGLFRCFHQIDGVSVPTR
jgi:hypothetical protein